MKIIKPVEIRELAFRFLELAFEQSEGDINKPCDTIMGIYIDLMKEGEGIYFDDKKSLFDHLEKIKAAGEYLRTKKLIVNSYTFRPNGNKTDVIYNTGSYRGLICETLPYPYPKDLFSGVDEDSLDGEDNEDNKDSIFNAKVPDQMVLCIAAISITTRGIDVIHESKKQPKTPGKDFLDTDITNKVEYYNSKVQIITNSPGSTQNMDINESNYSEILKIIREIEAKCKDLGLDKPENLGIKADVETLKVQLSSKTPRKSIIDECWPDVKSFAIQAGAALFSQASWAFLTGGPR